MKFVKKFERNLDRFIGLVSVISYAGFLFIMLLTVFDVFGRFVYNKPIIGSYEIIERTVFCAVFASFAYAQRQKAHIHITMLVILFPSKLKFICTALTGLLASVIAMYITYAAFVHSDTASSFNYTTGVLRIPLYPFYWLQCFTMGAFSLTLFFDSLKSIIALFDDDTAREVHSTWS